MNIRLINGDCRVELAAMPDNSVDSVITDPPYELGFMGRGWDKSGIAFDPAVWAQCLRVLKPGGHLLAFGAPRLFHRLVCAIEDAGFEIRDQILWGFGSGFPKSLNVSKAMDKAAGADREITGPGQYANKGRRTDNNTYGKATPSANDKITAPATPEALQWDGWGTALKPAFEPICMARKPLSEKNVAANVLRWGTGAINIDACRVPGENPSIARRQGSTAFLSTEKAAVTDAKGQFGMRASPETYAATRPGEMLGRFPANLIHDGSDEIVAVFPSEAGAAAPVHRRNGDKFRGTYGAFGGNVDEAGSTFQGDSGSAARFFYCVKASKLDREEGCEALPRENEGDRANRHETVKPTDLMAYLCRLVTPPGGTVLDPFTGSGSTGKAAMIEGFDFIGIEQQAKHIPVAEARIRFGAKVRARAEAAGTQLGLL